MPWLLIAEGAACLIAVVGIGWPWGVVAAVGCLVIPVAVVEVMLRLVPVHAARTRREPLRVNSMRIWPPRKTIPGTAGERVIEGKVVR